MHSNCAVARGRIDRLAPEQGDFLQKMLCRRLAKLAIEQEKSQMRDDYQHLIGVLGPMFQRPILSMTRGTEAKWNAFKDRSIRKIPRLPHWAGSGDLRLTLPNSGPYLQEVINEAHPRRSEQRMIDKSVLDQAKGTQQFREITLEYSLLAQRELEIETKPPNPPLRRTSAEGLCLKYASDINAYLSLVGDGYSSGPEQNSIFILTLFQL